ncbi:hypothetical protein O2W14_10515 [Modestobacter sp. VKM Ac-2986]|uniref:hypothetical protein n=1 Tax=Modestobacter sp. VKM Ac-2986 TaxID=3004140 RepID=UPI0022AB9AC3|nr:hypothetical protein [Modestobacter sp. VKM Ac-2986]MCZ2829264.1 hypothetical protein [Modestobacter sp. VKM Ac-2986]
MDRRTDDFTAFVADCEQQLRGTALLLTGDPGQADDLVVAALARTHRRWRRLDSPAEALEDTRAALVAAVLGRTRLPASGGSIGTLSGPDDGLHDGLYDGPDGDLHGGDQLDPGDRRWLTALADLEPTARVVVVLRLVEGQDEESVATLLGRSPQEVADALDAAVETLGGLLDAEPEPAQAAAPAAAPAPAPAGAWTAAPQPTGDLDAVFRRPGVPAPPGPVPAPAPVTAPAGAAPADDGGDPWAIYRRPS